MIPAEPDVEPEATHFDNVDRLTADELGLVTRTPKPEDALLAIEEHLREIGLYSG